MWSRGLQFVKSDGRSDGQAAAIDSRYPPLVSASRTLGEWQTFDILFEVPRFEGDNLIELTYFTVVHYGVLVPHHVAVVGRVAHKDPGPLSTSGGGHRRTAFPQATSPLTGDPAVALKACQFRAHLTSELGVRFLL